MPSDVFAAWTKVATCEEGGWNNAPGPVYYGSLGISQANWIAYGGQQFGATASQATAAEQIVVAERIQVDPPDQHGCAPW